MNYKYVDFMLTERYKWTPRQIEELTWDEYLDYVAFISSTNERERLLAEKEKNKKNLKRF